ncbi:hypothetical protein ACQKMD_16725 [Viridibacillus sp. NPDC096237]|uniref:hypothetical protein n=1 Tax=Viridibacillus sp. NPDC096237 TaxID=3390721 RepID=UPI003D086EEF
MTKVQLIKNIPINDVLKEVTFVDDREALPGVGQFNMLYVIRVDIINGNSQTLCIWSGTEYIPINGGSAGNQDYNQVMKLGVIASASVPRQYSISIDYTSSFLRAPLEILKFISGQQNIVVTQMGFDNTDSTDFIENAHVVFDGKMKLKTKYEYTMMKGENFTHGTLYRTTIDTSIFKELIGINLK